MIFVPELKELESYLKCTEVVDYDNIEIKKVCDELVKGKTSDFETARVIYGYVRDRVSHSGDINASEVTCNASEVLEKGHGICCAKSHLFAAMLRYKGIPAGFCYQSLYEDGDEVPYRPVHGLNGVFIGSIGRWIRLDARGNKEGVRAEFSLDAEKVAWPARPEFGERDIPVIFVEPPKGIVDALRKSKNRKELNLLWRGEFQNLFQLY